MPDIKCPVFIRVSDFDENLVADVNDPFLLPHLHKTDLAFCFKLYFNEILG